MLVEILAEINQQDTPSSFVRHTPEMTIALNKAYKVVYNESTGTYVAVSELETSQGKSISTVGNMTASASSKLSLFPFAKNAKVIAFSMFMASILPFQLAEANVVSTTYVCGNGSGSGTGPDGTVYSGNPGAAIDGSAIGAANWSIVAGCGADGGGSAGIYASTVYGAYSKVTGNHALALGFSSIAAKEAVAVGADANAVGHRSIAVGTLSTASGGNSIAIGATSTGYGANSVAIGRASSALDDAVAIGNGANANQGGTEYNGIAIGKNSIAWSHGIALGVGASADGSSASQTTPEVGAIAIGYNAKIVNATGGIAIGNLAQISNQYKDYGLALGYQANSNENYAIALGGKSNAMEVSSLALGYNSKSTNKSAVAVGANTTASGAQTIAIGESSIASGSQSISTGFKSQALGPNSYAFGSVTLWSGAPPHPAPGRSRRTHGESS